MASRRVRARHCRRCWGVRWTRRSRPRTGSAGPSTRPRPFSPAACSCPCAWPRWWWFLCLLFLFWGVMVIFVDGQALHSTVWIGLSDSLMSSLVNKLWCVYARLKQWTRCGMRSEHSQPRTAPCDGEYQPPDPDLARMLTHTTPLKLIPRLKWPRSGPSTRGFATCPPLLCALHPGNAAAAADRVCCTGRAVPGQGRGGGETLPFGFPPCLAPTTEDRDDRSVSTSSCLTKASMTCSCKM